MRWVGGFCLFLVEYFILDRPLWPAALQTDPRNPKYGVHTSSDSSD